MKKRNLLKIAAVVCICSIIMTGCFPTPQIPEIEKNNNDLSFSEETSMSEDSGNVSDRQFSEHITDNGLEMFNINADVAVPEGFNPFNKVSSAIAHYKQWDGEKIVSDMIKNNLISGKSIVETESGENSGPNDLYYCYDLDDDSFVSTSAGNFIFKTKKYIDYQYSAFFDNQKNYIFEDSLKNTFGSDDIDGIDKQQSIEQSKKIISMLDLKYLAAEPEIYSMTADKLQDLINSNNILHYADENEDGEPDETLVYTDDESAYLIMYPIRYNGIVSSGSSTLGENEILDCSKVFFVYSKDGLIGFEFSGIFENDNAAQSNTLISPEAVCNTLKEQYNDIILSSPVNISLFKLVFINRHDFYAEDFTEYKIEPIWLVYGNSVVSKGEYEFQNDLIYYVSALTGEIITSMGG